MCVKKRHQSISKVPCKMSWSLIIFILGLFASKIQAFDFDESVNPEFNYVPSDFELNQFGEARFLGNFSDLGNNSLLTLGAIFVVGVILFGNDIS